MKVLVRNVDNVFFFSKQKTAYDLRICDWSSDVCSSDLADGFGIKAAALTSADDNRQETIAHLRAGDLDLIYVAPERASGEGFRNLLSRIPLSLIAIDEAQCVSEWGHDFRPDYRLLRPLLDSFQDVPRLALTATADRQPRGDLQIGRAHV